MSDRTTNAAAPLTDAERLALLDLLRGFALLGILLVNFDSSHILAPPSAADEVALAIVSFFAQGSFYPLFSFLFGMGFAMQLLRAEQRGTHIVPLYARRLIVLLAIGALHSLLVWPGDILQQYAVIGFVLLLFRKRSPRTLLITVAVLLVIAISHDQLTELAGRVRSTRQDQNVTALAQEVDDKTSRARSWKERVAVTEGTYADVVRARVAGYDPSWLIRWAIWSDTPIILAMFLMGLYAGRRRILQDPAGNRRALHIALFAGLALGVAGGALTDIFPLLARRGVMPELPAWTHEASVIEMANGLGFTAFYVAAFALWIGAKSRLPRAMSPVGAVGRMGLTNYLMESVLITWTLSAYGLGLSTTTGAARSLLLKLAVYCALIPISVLWLRFFRFGPAEWLWRSLTYLRLQPMRRKGVSGPAPALEPA